MTQDIEQILVAGVFVRRRIYMSKLRLINVISLRLLLSLKLQYSS